MLWNVEGLGNIVRTMPRSIFYEDAIVLTETFLQEPLELDGYYSKHRLATQGPLGRPSGGISCYIKPWLAPIETIVENKNILLVQTKVAKIICVYFQPEISAEQIIDIINDALEYVDKDDAVILTGDLNCRVDKANQKSNLVINFLQAEGLDLINEPEEITYIAHNGSSTIDLCFINNNIEAITQKTLTTGVAPLRKHLPVLTKLATKGPIDKKPRTTTKYRRELDMELLTESSETVREIRGQIETGNINSAVTGINRLLTSSMIRVQDHGRKAKKWFDRECYSMRKKVLQALHETRNSIDKRTYEHYNILRRQYKALLKGKRQQHLEDEGKKMIAEATLDPFKALKAKQPRFPHDINIETWEKHFQTTLNKEAKDIPPTRTSQPEEIDYFRPITEEEIEKTIKETKKQQEEIISTMNTSKQQKTYCSAHGRTFLINV